jgi:tripartite ATP-independent transporter DctP family solute receptor
MWGKSIRIFALVLAVVLLFGVTSVVGGKDEKYVVRLAFMDPPDPYSSVNTAFMVVFKNKVEEYTGGQVEVKLYPSGQLGSDLDNYKRVRTGEIEMSGAGAGSLGNALYPQLAIFELPYLFPDNKVAFDVLSLDNPFIQELVDGIKKKAGVGIIAFIPQSFRNLTNSKRPIKKPGDLKGLKIRTQEVKAHMEMVRATGAQVVPIPYTELYTSLQTGVVDGQENPLNNIRAMNFFEVQKYLTLTKHAINVPVPIYNVKWFESLPKDIQMKILKAADAARVTSAGMAELSDAVNLEKFRESGMDVYIPSSEELEEFKRVMQPPALEWYRANIEGGAELLTKLQREIEKAQERYESFR